MRKTLAVICLMLFSSLCFCLSACGGGNNVENNITILVIDDLNNSYSYAYTTSKVYLKDVLDEMKNDIISSNEKPFTYEYMLGSYGAYINSVIGIETNEKSFWGIYTDNFENGIEEFSITFGSKHYYSSTFGISSYKINNNETVILKYSNL